MSVEQSSHCPSDHSSPPNRPGLAALAWLVARDSNLTFGGGTATAEVLRRSLAKRAWLSDEDHRQIYAISRLTPGTNLLAYCTAIGWHLRGASGATVAWVASSVPASIIAIVATIFYEQASTSPVLSIGVLVATGIALLLLLSSAWHLARPQLAGTSRLRSLAIITFVAGLVLLGMPPIGILLSSAALGAVWRIRHP